MLKINLTDMDAIVMRVELHDYINHADEKELELLYTIWLNNALDEYKWWDDEELVAELEQISADMNSGKDKGMPWEEVKEKLLKRNKKREV